MAEPDLAAWVGRTAEASVTLDVAPAQRLAAVLDRAGGDLVAGAPLPPVWHWVYFVDVVAHAGLGTDGHPARGGFMPPVDLRRRMFAGARLSFLDPLPLGAVVTRRSRIADITIKEGRSGRLAFVTVEHDLVVDGRVAVTEVSDIVYTAASPAVGAPADRPVPAAPWSASLSVDVVRLFRFSAVTFNSHRIHYDRPYAVDVEGYPALVVQGPLLALALTGLATDAGLSPTALEFRAVGPAFEGAPVELRGWPFPGEQGADLAAYAGDGRQAMTARVAWR